MPILSILLGVLARLASAKRREMRMMNVITSFSRPWLLEQAILKCQSKASFSFYELGELENAIWAGSAKLFLKPPRWQEIMMIMLIMQQALLCLNFEAPISRL